MDGQRNILDALLSAVVAVLVFAFMMVSVANFLNLILPVDISPWHVLGLWLFFRLLSVPLE